MLAGINGNLNKLLPKLILVDSSDLPDRTAYPGTSGTFSAAGIGGNPTIQGHANPDPPYTPPILEPYLEGRAGGPGGTWGEPGSAGIGITSYNWWQGTGGAGGSGIVILKVLTSLAAASTTGSPTISTSGSYTIYKFTQSGTITF